MFKKNCLCYYNFFYFVYPHKDKLVLQCIKDILIDFFTKSKDIE